MYARANLGNAALLRLGLADDANELRAIHLAMPIINAAGVSDYDLEPAGVVVELHAADVISAAYDLARENLIQHAQTRVNDDESPVLSAGPK